jgi:hypothetical protein
MSPKTQVTLWIDVSTALMQRLVGSSPNPSCFGIDMDPAAFAKLVYAQSSLVDHALTAMAVAQDEHEVASVFGQLAEETKICLLSRWLHYTHAWSKLLDAENPRLWVPPNKNEIWRAVFLAMTGEDLYSSAAAASIWPETFI